MKRSLLAARNSVLLFLLTLLTAVPACGDSSPGPLPIGKATDLHTTLALAWETSNAPLIATSPAGKIFVIWLGKASESAAPDADVPFIPIDYTFPVARLGWSDVPGISIYDGKQWSKPQLLVNGMHDCKPLFAWCSGEDLNLLVSSNDADSFYHLQYQPQNRTWTRLHIVPESPSSYSTFLMVGNVLHVGEASDTVKYLRYDGKEWSKPVLMPGTISTSRPHLAATSDGAVHLLWRAPSGGDFGHFTIAADGQTSQSTIDFPILRDEFDAATDPSGNLVVAYQADLPENDPDAGAVHLRTLRNGKWSDPSLVGKAAGRLLGGVRTISFQDHLFLTWLHQADYTSGSMHVSGAVRSFSSLDSTGWSDPKPVATTDGRFGGQSFMNTFFIGLHADDAGRIHVAWGSGPFNYHAVAAQFPSTSPSTPAHSGK